MQLLPRRVFCSKKSGKSTKKTGDKTRRRRRVETFSSYIYKVLKQVHPGAFLSPTASAVSPCARR